MAPPRKPTALKILHGDGKINPSRINRAEPQPAGMATAPESLSDDARAIWDSIAPDMIRTGVLTVWDIPAFAETCESLVMLRAARLAAQRELAGDFVPMQGQASPVGAWQKTSQITLGLVQRFGMTPADRTRLTTPQTTARSGADDLLSGSG